jgi:hypothetical protein
MQTLTIPPEQWTSHLKKLSQSFGGWPVSLDGARAVLRFRSTEVDH